MPLEEIASEQEKLSTQLAHVESRLVGAAAEYATVVDNLNKALVMATSCHSAYMEAPDDVRRLFNQAFFDRLYIDDDGASAELIEPFKTIRQVGQEWIDNKKDPQDTTSVWGSRP